MKDLKQKLMIEQMDAKLKEFTPLLKNQPPESGWLNAIRTLLKMSFRQFGNRIKVTPQGAEGIEKREKDGSITLRSLEEAGRALNMKLVYGFVPMDGSIEKTIEKRAREIALEIVKTTSNTMALEDQENTSKRLKKAVEDKARQLVYEMPRHLWD
ncbi:MAG: mobile mystery protein A [Flavobacteriaceae bacterium]|nr:MAG: mobile mystery protein A [Flavobacteriaceae bacterium]